MQTVDLYVSNLDPVAILDDEDLASVFKQFGTVVGAKLATDPNGNSLGVGFVRMSNPQEAEHARLQMQGRGGQHYPCSEKYTWSLMHLFFQSWIQSESQSPFRLQFYLL